MSGRIIFEPKNPTPCDPTPCDRGQCEDKPRAESYRDGTIWKCDECGREWVVWSGAQYNEPFSAWEIHREPKEEA